jgi:hypothetical protein
MRAITLVPVFHDRQAPGARPAELERVIEHAWAPLVEALHAQPTVRAGLAVSGSLARHLEQRSPALLKRLRELAARGQVEVIGAPSHGAVLHLIPERDAVLQLRQHLRWLHERLGVPVRGVWPTLGAWDPALPRVVGRGGGAYTFVDAALVAATGALPAAGGWIATERGGHVLPAIPLDGAVGARLPFEPVDALIGRLRRRCDAGGRVAAWPLSVEDLGWDDAARGWCFGGATPWVPGLLEAISRHTSWLKTAVPWQVVDRLPPAGTAWPVSGTSTVGAADRLPPDQARTWTHVQEALQDDPSEALLGLSPWLTGPPIDTVLARYDVAARLHRASLRASAALALLRRDAARSGVPADKVEAIAALVAAGQSSLPLDPSRGGGLRDPAVRHAAFRAVITAELRAQALLSKPAPAVEKVDRGPDGHPEVLLRGAGLRVLVRPGAGGAIAELGVEGVGNLVNTLARRPEHWHAEVEAQSILPELVFDEVAEEPPAAPGGEVLDDYEEDEPTAQGIPVTGEPAPLDLMELDIEAIEVLSDAGEPARPLAHILPTRLSRGAGLDAVDGGPRLALIDRLLGEAITLDNLARGQHPEEGDLAWAPYRLERAEVEDDGGGIVVMGRDGRVRGQPGEEDGLLGLLKRLRLLPGRPELHVSWELWNRSRTPVQTRLAVELNIGLDGVLGPGRAITLPGCAPALLGEGMEAERVQHAVIDLGAVTLELETDDPAHLWHYPVRSLRRLPGRAAPVDQAACFVLAWPLGLWGEERVHQGLRLRVSRKA